MYRVSRGYRNRGIPTDNRCGAVLVEFALCVPLALFITFGMIDLARVNMLRNTAENAAYEGSRAGIVPGATAAAAESAALNIMTAIGARGATATCSPSSITKTTKQVTVTVEVPISRNLWAGKIAFNSSKISRSCTLTRERTSGL